MKIIHPYSVSINNLVLHGERCNYQLEAEIFQGYGEHWYSNLEELLDIIG